MAKIKMHHHLQPLVHTDHICKLLRMHFLTALKAVSHPLGLHVHTCTGL